MSPRFSQVMAVVVSLAVVGLLTSQLPEYVPDEYSVVPNAANVASTSGFTAELIDVTTADSVLAESEYDEKSLGTDHIFVLARVKLVAHGTTLSPELRLVTADEYTYTELDEYGFPSTPIVYIGEYNITTYIFEVPRDKVAGATLGVSAVSSIGVQPVRPVVRFPLPELDDAPGEVVVKATEKGPVQ